MKLIYRITVFILLLCIYADAQVVPFISEKSLSPSEKYSVQSWTTENGLPQNSINDIAQTRDGYLWLATFDGLVRFDGIRFTTFSTGNTPALKTNGIKKLFTDNEGRLWIISADGNLALFYKNKFTAIPLPSKLSITTNVIADFENESVLILGSDNKFYQYRKNSFEEVIFGAFGHIASIQTLSASQLYIATSAGLFSYINDELKEVEALKGKPVSRLYRSPSSEVIAESGNELFAVRANSCKKIGMFTDLSRLGDYSIGYDDEQQLSILTENGIIADRGNAATVLSMQSGLSSNSIRSIFVDREKNLWIGTNNGGLNKLKHKLFRAYSKEDGMLSDGATAILESKNGAVYIGNNCGGISEFYNNRFQQKLKQPKDNCVWSLMEDAAQSLWIGTYGGGAYRCKKNGEILNFSEHEGLSSNIVLSIYEDSQQITWMGTSNGLNVFTGNSFRQVDTSFHHAITYIHEDKNGGIWFCTDAGLAVIKNNKLTILDKTKGFRETATRYIYEDAEGTLWIGTHGSGLARLKNGKVYYFSDHTTQLDKNVWSIAEDRNGNLWMPSNSGMYVADKRELNDMADNNSRSFNPVFLGREDGLKSIEFNGGFQPSVLKSSKNEFWFPTVKGVAVVDPQLLPERAAGQIVIEQLLADDKVLELKDSISLTSANVPLAILFTSPSFSYPAKICFEYKIEGLDDKWVSIGTSRELRLKEVPAGANYIRIRIAGSSTSSEATIFVSKALPAWKDPRFVTIASLVVVLFILLITIAVIGFVRKRERIKTQINKQYANIELKALQAQLNPHFIFNCLNSIQHFILVNDEVSASNYLTKFSMLMRKFLEHSKSNMVTLQEEIELLRLYVELEALRSRNRFNFQLKIDPGLDIFNIEIPGMLFQPFVENAITHGLLNKESKGTLLLSFGIDDNHVVGIIEDDGVGRKKAVEINSNTYKDHASRGMEIIKERIAVLNYIENIRIEMQVIDKMSPENVPEGTRVVIKIPI
ncbi:MAG: hypothetical protein JWO09_2128 [Bacteroidetes bacterium]|nr:hypothetical protein [Bacteroidota bacterium]